MLKFILIILDGFGLRKEKRGNAVALANTPTLDRLINNSPISSIQTAGRFVGLPDGVMGNSEVGHMNIGAGRIIEQDLVKINNSIVSDTLKNNINLNKLFNYTKKNNSTLHLIGLVSDGGVHSHIDHFKYIIDKARDLKINKIAIHAITDGRDTSPTSGIKFVNNLESYIKTDKNYNIVSICGRFYAMDRDSRWDRIEKAYRLYMFGEGELFHDCDSAINASYNKDITDEFILPVVIEKYVPINDDDAVLMLNFRADRMRQIVSAINETDFKYFETQKREILFTCMTKYKDIYSYPVLFESDKINNIFPEVLSNNNYRQLRIAETEKYAHVTYFFNGGNEKQFIGESRCLIPSPKVETYDLQPEMSAKLITKETINAIESNLFEAIILNFANPDMVGHTGNLKAAIKAIEIVDNCINNILNSTQKQGWAVFLTADHGNLEMMLDDKTGQIHTAHTTLPVPLIMNCNNKNYLLKKTGKLADIAPTILDYLKIPKPDDMTGDSLLDFK